MLHSFRGIYSAIGIGKKHLAIASHDQELAAGEHLVAHHLCNVLNLPLIRLFGHAEILAAGHAFQIAGIVKADRHRPWCILHLRIWLGEMVVPCLMASDEERAHIMQAKAIGPIHIGQAENAMYDRVPAIAKRPLLRKIS